MGDHNLVMPAAGHGSRLGAGPKALANLNGKPFIDHVLAAFDPHTFRVTVVIRPEHVEAFEAWKDASPRARAITFGILESRSGAESTVFGLNLAASTSSSDSRYLVAWSDQVGLTSDTVEGTFGALESADFSIPLVETTEPYTHFLIKETPAGAEFESILRQRVGDELPSVGISDVGLFGLTARGVASFVRESMRVTSPTELDFLDLIPPASACLVNSIVPAHQDDLVAVNTPEDLRNAEHLLRDSRLRKRHG